MVLSGRHVMPIFFLIFGHRSDETVSHGLHPLNTRIITQMAQVYFITMLIPVKLPSAKVRVKLRAPNGRILNFKMDFVM